MRGFLEQGPRIQQSMTPLSIGPYLESDDLPAAKKADVSPWAAYRDIDHADLYHDGQSLHTCTGCYCDFR